MCRRNQFHQFYLSPKWIEQPTFVLIMAIVTLGKLGNHILYWAWTIISISLATQTSFQHLRLTALQAIRYFWLKSKKQLWCPWTAGKGLHTSCGPQYGPWYISPGDRRHGMSSKLQAYFVLIGLHRCMIERDLYTHPSSASGFENTSQSHFTFITNTCKLITNVLERL